MICESWSSMSKPYVGCFNLWKKNLYSREHRTNKPSLYASLDRPKGKLLELGEIVIVFLDKNI